MKIEPTCKPILDPEIAEHFLKIDLNSIFKKGKWNVYDIGKSGSQEIGQTFTNFHAQWIRNSKLNNIEGLDDFPIRHVINGCTEAISEYHWMFRNHRLRLYNGEYMFTGRLSLGTKFTPMEEDELKEGDALIVSVPFAHTGEIPIDFDATMNICTKLNIPVFLDFCLFGTCYDINVKVNYPCVVAAAFSTSKTLATGNFRVGTLFAKESPDHIGALNTFYYTPLLAAIIHREMLYNYSADYIPTKYRKRQEDLCDKWDVNSSKVMMIGTSNKPFEIEDIKKISGGAYANGWPSVKIRGEDIYRLGLMHELISHNVEAEYKFWFGETQDLEL